MKNKKKIILTIVAILIIALIITYVVPKIIGEKNKQGNTPTQETTENTTKEVSLIDMSNTENVNIVDGEKQNNSEQIKKERTYQGLTITDIQLVTNDGVSEFTAKVINDSTTDFEGKVVNLKFTNKDGSDYAQLEVFIPTIKAGGTNSINAGTTADITNAYSFAIEQ